MFLPIQNLFSRAWGLRHQALKYAIVGGFGFALDYGIFSLLFAILSRTTPFHDATAAVIATTISQVCTAILGFYLNLKWSFKDGGDSATHKKAIRFFVLAGWNYLFSAFAIYFMVHDLHIIPYLAKIIVVAIIVCWNFLLYKFVVYK